MAEKSTPNCSILAYVCIRTLMYILHPLNTRSVHSNCTIMSSFINKFITEMLRNFLKFWVQKLSFLELCYQDCIAFTVAESATFAYFLKIEIETKTRNNYQEYIYSSKY